MAQKGYSVTNYIDDIVGYSVVSKSNYSFQSLRALLLELGFEISEKKVVKPAKNVTCLDVDIILTECQSWADKRECTKRQLQSLLGKLRYITIFVRLSRPFLNRMLDLLKSLDKLSKTVGVGMGLYYPGSQCC